MGMRNRLICFLSGTLLLILLTQAVKAQSDATKGFVFLELFTSEGCASCPPADLLMEKITHEYKDKPVYVLCFHVDYFNRAGWVDPFSNALYSRRQELYDQRFQHYVYTPQLVINGNSQTSGYNASAVYRAIRQQLASASPSRIRCQAGIKEGEIEVTFEAGDHPAGSVLNIALLQRSGGSHVERGENAGKTLHHANIVRALQSTTDARGSLLFKIPQGLSPEDIEIILWQQLPQNGEITSAAFCAIPKTNGS